MRWLMMVLIVSLGALLMAAAGLARYIWLQHARARPNPEGGSGPVKAPDRTAGTDTETEV
jgi:hypothetical protein